MIVVADTSPINYLILIEEIDILTKMYGRVVIPHTVYEELLRGSAPHASPLRSFTMHSHDNRESIQCDRMTKRAADAQAG